MYAFILFKGFHRCHRDNDTLDLARELRKMRILLNFVNICLSPLGLKLNRKKRILQTEQTIRELSLELSSIRTRELAIRYGLPNDLVNHLVDNFPSSHSQLQQDLIALFLFKDTSGSYCEVGGGDGVTYSNSYLLEKLGWRGLIVEPARANLTQIAKNRSCDVSKKAAWSVSDLNLKFVETKNLELSTLDKFKDSDSNSSDRISVSGEYFVKTTSLTDVFEEFEFPANFEYLSVDTEGSELEVLKGLDFEKFSPLLITIEHNFTSNREIVQQFLLALGYERICKDFSRHDDWYLHVSKYSSLHKSQSLIGLLETH
jgi:FkbM family methyltransferase